ncbi:MAG: hypothetical protein Q9170_004866 [Blastenia crenularia]
MGPHLFRSKSPADDVPPQHCPAPTTSDANKDDTRYSTGSTTSIADVEAGFLPGASSKCQKGYNILGLRHVFSKRRHSSETDSTSEEKPKRALTKSGYANIVLSVVLFGVIIVLLVLEIPHHHTKPFNGVQMITSRWGLPSPSRQKALISWPTDFSRDITPIPVHSHNDYWRRVPLYDALTAGCTGVEADVWFDPSLKDDLFVGHTRKSLTSARTLKSLYINPLLSILKNQNAASNLLTNDTTTTPSSQPNNNKIGIYDTKPSESLTLLIDLKTNPDSTFPAVLQALAPLHEAGYLTTWSPATGLVRGPITVVATGNTKFAAHILSPANTSPLRTIFFDAPLPALSASHPSQQDLAYNTNNSYYASVSFDKAIGGTFYRREGMLRPEQLRKVREQIQGARERGLVSPLHAHATILAPTSVLDCKTSQFLSYHMLM